MKKIILALFLTGCGATFAPIDDAVSVARKSVAAAVAEKPECREVGAVCDTQIDAVAAAGRETAAAEYRRGWNRGLLWGFLGGVVAAVAVAFAVRKIMRN